MNASALLNTIASSPRPDREAAVLAARGLWVEWPMCEVRVISPGRDLRIQVTSDVFALGSQDEPIRVPLSGPGCQRVADELGLQMITPAMSDSIWHNAKLKLQPLPWGPPYDESMLSMERVLVHNDRIEAQRRGVGGLVAGHKKDVVVTNRLVTQPSQVAIYGWHKQSGQPIQPLSLVHEKEYADYSHGLRLASPECVLDGQTVRLADVMEDPEVCSLVSRDGPMRCRRYLT